MLVQSLFSFLWGLFLVSSTAIRGESMPSRASSTLTLGRTVTATSVPINAAQSILDVDAYKEAPAELALEQVHVYLRHGARMPVGIYMSEPPASIPEHWLMCKSRRINTVSTSFPSGHLNPGGDSEFLPMRKMVELGNGTTVEDECLLGELTDVGRQSTYSYGTALRRLYVENLGFLPDILKNDSETYFRSTNMHRTMESLQQVMHGLYPASKLGPGVIPTLLVRNGKDENLVANVQNCKRLEILFLQFASEARSIYNDKLRLLDEKLSKYIGGNPVRLDGKPRAFAILDTIRSCQAHGVNVPPEFKEKEVIDLIEKAVVNEWFGDIKSEEIRSLGFGKLFADLLRRMEYKVEHGEKDPLKILVHSTHDTGIAPLASSLGIFDEKWPAFASSITFELFARKQTEREQRPSFLQFAFGAISPFRTSREHFVRVRYQNKDMQLPACAKDGDHLPGHPEFCTYAAFQARMRELIPDDWDASCSTTAVIPPDAVRHW